MTNTVKFAKLYELATIPTRKNPSDAGMDLYACFYYDDQAAIIKSGDYEIIPLGIAVEIPPNCFGWITNKSSKNYLIGGGIVDSGYRGELLVKIFNTSNDTVVIRHGDAIAQLLIVPAYILYLQVVETEYSEIENTDTSRGQSGGILSQYNKEYRCK